MLEEEIVDYLLENNISEKQIAKYLYINKDLPFIENFYELNLDNFTDICEDFIYYEYEIEDYIRDQYDYYYVELKYSLKDNFYRYYFNIEDAVKNYLDDSSYEDFGFEEIIFNSSNITYIFYAKD